MARSLAIVTGGAGFIGSEVVRQLIGSRRQATILDRLTPREREVLGLMAEGHSNSGLAQHLSITERAVEKHVSAGIGSIRRAWIDGDQAADRLQPAIHSAGSR